MNARDIMKALLEGKKVGTGPFEYIYLNIAGELVVESEYDTTANASIVGHLLLWDDVTVQPEEGP